MRRLFPLEISLAHVALLHAPVGAQPAESPHVPATRRGLPVGERNTHRTAHAVMLTWLALVAMALLPVHLAARELANIDTLSGTPVRATDVRTIAMRAMIDKRGSAIARLNVEERHAVPTFLAIRPGASMLDNALVKQMSAENAARAHLKSFADLYRLSSVEIDAAPLHHIESLFNGAQLAKFTNQKDGVEIFRESAAVLMKSSGEVTAIGGWLGATANVAVLSAHPATPFKMSVAEAVAHALGDYRLDASVMASLQRTDVSSIAEAIEGLTVVSPNYQHFTLADNPAPTAAVTMIEPARAKPVWFRVPDGLIAGYYVELQINDLEARSQDYYSYVIAADDGRILFRNNQSADAAFTYKVWADSTGINQPQTGPQGRNDTPHPTGLNDGYQAPFVAQTLVTLQNGPISTADPWLALGATKTIGNNVEAWANHVAPPAGTDGFDADPDECNVSAPFIGDFHACTSSAGTFAYTYDPNAAPKVSRSQSMAAVVNLFYTTNWLHDWYYDAGFKEIDGNAQTSNFGRGGLGNDSMKAQAQDNSGVNNANMFTPADGARPRMRMYLFTGNEAAAVTVTPPGTNLPVGLNQFGPTTFDVSAPLALASDSVAPLTDGCQPLANNVAGKIVLVDRGTCSFKTKVFNAQTAGALGVIVANNVAGGAVSVLGDDLSIPTAILIPALMVSFENGAAIKTSLQAGPVTARLQRFIGPDRDGALDNSIIAHEFGHYISNRLVGNANGLATTQSRGLGEGWSDFHALLFMARAEDALAPGNANFAGVYAVGAYAEDGPLIPGATQGYASYSGLRRYPYSSNLARNPLTFKHIQTGQSLPTNPPPRFATDNAETHATGEIWASMLWGCYSNLLRDTVRLSFAQAQDRMKRYIVAAYKLTPMNPTLVEARDALFAAIGVNDPADLSLCMAAFAQRGAGIGAQSGDRYSETNAGIVESFSVGNDIAIADISFAVQAAASCDNDAYLDMGETGVVSVTVKNTGNATLTGATLALSGAGLAFPAGPSLTLPVIAPAASATVSKTVRLAQQDTIGVRNLTVSVDHASLTVPGARVATLPILTGRDGQAATSNVDDVEAVTSLWTPSLQNTSNAALNWARMALTSTNHVWHGPSGDAPGLAWLTSPPIALTASGALSISFDHRYAFEHDTSTYFDGGVIEVSEDGGATWVDVGAGIYSGVLDNPFGASNPLAGRLAVVGVSNNYPNFAQANIALSPSYLGKTIRVRFGIGTDSSAQFGGWDLDNIAIVGASSPPFGGYQPDAFGCVSLLPSAGNMQSAIVATNFATPLKILAMGGDGLPIPGATISFTVPATGAGLTFSGGGTSANAVTDANGFATATSMTANNIAGGYNVTANIGARSATFALTNLPSASGPNLLSVKSRKNHPGLGAVDIDILYAQPLAGQISVEPRTIGAGHVLRFTFDRSIANAGVPSVRDVNLLAVGSAVAVASGSIAIVTLTGIDDGKRVSVKLSNVDGSGFDAAASIGFLVGDMNSTGRVNASDISATKSRVGQMLSTTNARFDADVNGVIDAKDVTAVKARAGRVIP